MNQTAESNDPSYKEDENNQGFKTDKTQQPMKGGI